MALVLAVLVCLLAVAIPFSLSMRHEQGGAAVRATVEDARRAAHEVEELAVARLGATAPDRDPTPWSDGAEEIAIDPEQAARELGISELGPRGMLVSARVEDLSGRIDLNAASLFLIARGLGLSTHLSAKLSADDKEIRLADGSFLQEQGFLWIDGEVTFYKHHDGGVVTDFMRPAMVPGVWEPALMPDKQREFEAGTEVVDFRAWMVAAWPFKANAGAGAGSEPAAPGAEARFDTLEQPLAIARFGRGALGPEQVERLHRLFTVHAPDAERARFGYPQRVTNQIESGQSSELRLDQGQFVGRGWLCRVTTQDGKVDYGFVRRCDPQGDGFHVHLEMPLNVSANAWSAVADFVLPRPVNVNTCSTEMLELLLNGVKRRASKTEIDGNLAAELAKRIVAARPLTGFKDVVALIEALVEKEKLLTGDQPLALLANAEHSGSITLETASAPFGYASEGTFDLESAASLNFAFSGREKARAFLHDVVSASASGRSQRLFATQRDFEEPWRVTRRARGWTTFPENLQLSDPKFDPADPPSRIVPMEQPFHRAASEELADVGARLAPIRLLGFVTGDGVSDVTIHFDEGKLASKHVDGWSLEDGPPPPFPTGYAGGGTAKLVAPPKASAGFGAGHGDPSQISIVGGLNTVPRLQPFAVSMWWNPGRGLSDGVLFDCGNGTAAQNRVLLNFAGRQILFRVFDASSGTGVGLAGPLVGKISYDFSDGLPLEADTWYHVTAFCRGNRADQMSLWVDGKPRGKHEYFTHLTGGIGQGKPTVPGSGISGGSISVRDADSFPAQGVVRIGNEVVEYTSKSKTSLRLQPDSYDPFGGRAARGTDSFGASQLTHPGETGVELYGYSAPLASDLPNGLLKLGQDQIGKFYVAMLDPAGAKDQITVPAAKGPDITIGSGYEATETEFPIVALDQKDAVPKDAFQKTGGYALILSLNFGSATGTDQNDKTKHYKLDKTSKGSILCGMECIYYDSFDGKSLKNVTRGGSLTGTKAPPNFVVIDNSSNGSGSGGGGSGGSGGTLPTAYLKSHAWLTKLAKPPFGHTWPDVLPSLVFPIGIRVAGSDLKQGFLIPKVDRGDGTMRAELLQLDLDFKDPKQGATEWARYNSICGDSFVHDDPIAARNVNNWATRWPGGDVGGAPPSSVKLLDIGLNPGNYTGKGLDDFIAEFDTDPVDPKWNNEYHFSFRSALLTANSVHAANAQILPVFRTKHFGGIRGLREPRPGRHDDVSVVEGGVAVPRIESHRINYGFTSYGLLGLDPDWTNDSMVGLRDPVGRAFVATPIVLSGSQTATQTSANFVFLADSRNFTRLLKHPSGELPMEAPNQLRVGAEIVAGGIGQTGSSGSSSGATTPGGGGGATMLDEVRVVNACDPNRWAAFASCALANDLDSTATSNVRVRQSSFVFPHYEETDTLVQTLGTVDRWPQDACVLQIGDDVVICNQLNKGDPHQLRIAPDGRTRFVKDPGFHHADEPVNLLPWLVMSRLTSGVSATESQLQIADANGFPRTGTVLIDQELLGYTDRQTGGDNGSVLFVPTFTQDGSGKGRRRGDAAFRARFGTRATNHESDSVVFWLPTRYTDGYTPQADFPELAAFEIPIAARRGLFHKVTWKEHSDDAQSNLVLQARVQGRGDFARDPDQDPDSFFFEKPGSETQPDLIDRQGDLLLLRFFVRYRDSAFDAVDFARNSWKRAPMLQSLGIEYLAEPVVELHEESR